MNPFGIATVLLLALGSPLSAEMKPNIDFIMADDFGWRELGIRPTEPDAIAYRLI